MQFYIFFILFAGAVIHVSYSRELQRSVPVLEANSVEDVRMKRAALEPTPTISRIISFLERKNIYKVYNLNRALEEWRRLDRGASREQTEQNLQQVITLMMPKIYDEYVRQSPSLNPNATGNSVIFRALLKFFVEAPDKGIKYKTFPFLSNQLASSGNFQKMSLDDAIIFGYIWLQEIIDGGLVHSPILGLSTEALQAENERIVRTVVQAANRIYPPGPDPNEPLTISEWWLRQRQHSTNVYKIYHLMDAMLQNCRKNGVETASLYEAMVDEFKKTGRALDAFELNMIDYLSYRMFGFVEHADPDRW